MNIQLKKGVLDLCVLSLLKDKDRYGYEISEIISKNMNISESTVYPILRKLKENKFLNSYLVEASFGPPRKYFTISSLGVEYLKKMRMEWEEFSFAVSKTLNYSEENNDRKKIS